MDNKKTEVTFKERKENSCMDCQSGFGLGDPAMV